MKLNLDNDQVEYKESSYGRTVYFYQSGGFATQIDEGSLYPIGSVIIIYNTGDVLYFVPDGDEYKLSRIITRDGIRWDDKTPTTEN